MAADDTRRDLTLGALLHDIGKFKQRARLSEDAGKPHEEIGYEWLKLQYGESLVASAARNHHAHNQETWLSNLSLIVYEADNCAATERRSRYDPALDRGRGWHRQVQLASVFSRVADPHAEKNSAVLPPPAFHLLTTQGVWRPPVAIEGRSEAEDYRQLWAGFLDEFDCLRKAQNQRNVETILHLLEKYTSFIPSITLKVYGEDSEATYRKHPDVSLFDHLKVTAALALCLYDYHATLHGEFWKEKLFPEEITGDHTWSQTAEMPFLLIGGDLSGVQRFIYTISSKGALKTLKGRSFFLELLTEYVVDRLLEEMRLHRSNVVFTGGGHFYLIAPNLPASQESLSAVREEINSFLLDKYNGSIQQFIAAVPFAKHQLTDVSHLWGDLSAELENLKRRKWDTHLERVLAAPAMPHPDCLTASCQVCGREDQALIASSIGEVSTDFCESCHDQFLLGSLLQSAARRGTAPVIYCWDAPPSGERDRFVRIGKCYYQPAPSLMTSEQGEPSSKARMVYHLNDWNLKRYAHPHSRPLMAGIYLPSAETGQELSQIVEEGFGQARLAVLRMDVDRLGRIFSNGIPMGERTLSRMASLSREFSLFFKYHLNGILENREGYPAQTNIVPQRGERRMTIVYSGGDDLFLIGHWLDVTEAAFDIRNAFADFTANPFITLSGGIALGDVHEPVYRLADRAGQAEKQAKQAGRRSITLSPNHTMRWEEAFDARNLLGLLVAFAKATENHLKLPDNSVSRGFLYRFLQIVREHKHLQSWIMPKLAYVFGRLQPGRGFEEPWGRLKQYVFSSTVNWSHLEVALIWLLMLMRKGVRS